MKLGLYRKLNLEPAKVAHSLFNPNSVRESKEQLNVTDSAIEGSFTILSDVHQSIQSIDRNGKKVAFSSVSLKASNIASQKEGLKSPRKLWSGSQTNRDRIISNDNSLAQLLPAERMDESLQACSLQSLSPRNVVGKLRKRAFK